MNTPLQEYLRSLAIGPATTHKNMTVVPLRQGCDLGPDYLTLSQALDRNLLTASEITEEGSIADLKVDNRANRPVLLLDGEELTGARQNRVVNTSILLKPRSETIIPVSCSERGRWSYTSPVFHDSGTVMSPHLRHNKIGAVSRSLRSSGDHRADQEEVWRNIDELADQHGITSKTQALRDVYAGHDSELCDYLDAFALTEGQHGLLVLAGGRVLGLDIVSRAEAFRQVFPKLIRSYALEAMTARRSSSARRAIELTREFIQACALCTISDHESVGEGRDWRITGSSINGSALAVEGEVIHLAIFRTGKTDWGKGLSSAASRRNRRFDC